MLAGRIFLRDFYLSRIECPPSLHSLQICKIRVTDYLGEDILVPTMFCSAEKVCVSSSESHIFALSHNFVYQSFDFVLKQFCKKRPENHYVERGDYQVISAEDDKVMAPSDFSAVGPGTHLAISIILRRRTNSRINERKCPQCGLINSTATRSAGWIDWEVVLKSCTYAIITLLLAAGRVPCVSMLKKFRLKMKMKTGVA